MPLFLAVLLLLAGILLLGYWWWLRMGRSARARAWVHGSERSRLNAMCAVPAIGALLISAALADPAVDGSVPAAAVCAVTIPAFLLLGLWGGLQIPLPGWYLPHWARAEVSRRREADRRARDRRKAERSKRGGNADTSPGRQS